MRSDVGIRVKKFNPEYEGRNEKDQGKKDLDVQAELGKEMLELSERPLRTDRSEKNTDGKEIEPLGGSRKEERTSSGRQQTNK